jgi:uncharacterized protein YrrD
MNKYVLVSLGALMMSTAALAQSPEVMTTIPANSVTVTHWLHQNVYDSDNNKVGDIEDVLLSETGQVSAVILGAGGFLDIGDHNVAVAFNSITQTTKDDKVSLTLDKAITKDRMKNAPGLQYDKKTMTWIPEKK